jgi:hypothetical protein
MHTVDDRIRVQCTRCNNSFREKLFNIRDGYQTQCPGCNRFITFDDVNQDVGIRRAMRDARRMRTGYVPPGEEPRWK